MADNNKGRIQQSRILNHPLGGRTGFLRELGATKNNSAVYDVWARSLGRRLLWPFKAQFQSPLFSEFSTFIYDEANKGIIGAMIPGQGQELSLM